ncbi:hypothetical protein NL351_29550, partial [Klebsiella pneumoniae]|nr:hypothetical protein [Klebsiella pneumoniae]
YLLFKKKNEDFLKKYQMEVKNPLQNGRCRIEPMDRIAIFLSKRYEKDNNGNFNIIQTPTTELVRTFTGLVNTVQCGYNAQGG